MKLEMQLSPVYNRMAGKATLLHLKRQLNEQLTYSNHCRHRQPLVWIALNLLAISKSVKLGFNRRSGHTIES